MAIPLGLVRQKKFHFDVWRRVWRDDLQAFYTIKAFPDANDATRMPLVTLASRGYGIARLKTNENSCPYSTALFLPIPLWKKTQQRKVQALTRALSDEIKRRQPRLETVKKLLAEGANVKMRVDGCDILSHAAWKNTDLLDLLVKKGARIK